MIKNYMNNIVDELKNNHSNLMFEAKEVIKNNGVKLHGIVIREEGNNLAPTIYVDKYYENKTPVALAAIDIYEVYMASRKENLDMSFFKDYEQIKYRLKAKLVNSINTDVAGISAADYGYSDLKIVPYVNLEEFGGNITVLPEHLDIWNVNIETVIDQALENIKNDIVIMNMSEFMTDKCGIPKDLAEVMFTGIDRFLVVTNSKMMFGAITAIVAKDLISEKMNGDYIVLPSSVHEIICVSKELGSANEFVNMVNEVNRTCVDAKDVLSDKVYEIAA